MLRNAEPQLADTLMLRTVAKSLHLLALALWLGGGVFFNLLAAPTIFATFSEVVATAPSDRTAYLPLLPHQPGRSVTEAQAKQEGDLARALAGAAVGPLFPRFYALEAVCAAVALLTAFAWINLQPGRRVHRARALVVGLAAALVAVGWPIAQKVSALRIERFAADAAAAQAATDAFASWHLVSLVLSLATLALVFLAVLLAARLPEAPQVVEILDEVK
jgi:hypothetical protein